MVKSAVGQRDKAPNVVIVEDHAGLGLRRVGVLDRVRARLKAPSLDHRLGCGAAPESDMLLALHAVRLSRTAQRRALAADLRGLAVAAQRCSRTRVPIDREGVHLALRELEAVAIWLEGDDPMDVHGIARLRTLLADGAGPLYRRGSPGALRRELTSTLHALSPTP